MFNRECPMRSFHSVPLYLLLCLSLFLLACGHSTAAFVAKGEEFLQKRKFNDALMQFKAAVESDRDSAAAHWGMARAYENLGQFNETVDELRKVVEFDGNNLEAKAKLGNYFLLVQPPMISETEKLRDEILKADHSFIEGHILSASIMAAQGRPDAEVVNAVQKAIDLDPKRVESYISLERLYMTRDKAAEAEATIQKGIAANPSSVIGYIEYGKFLTYADRDPEAEAQFNKAVELDPASIFARESIAEFYVTSRQLDLAEQTYKYLVEIQENSPESRLELAEFYSGADRKDEAIAVLKQILADAPEYVRARYRLGQIYLDRKDINGVNEQLDALMRINDDDAQALMLRSRLRIQENKTTEAIDDLDGVLKRYPSNKEALFLMAQIRISLGQIDQGRAFISDLERYHPTYLRAALLRIQAAFSAGDPGEAFKQSNELIKRVDAAVPNAETTAQVLHDLRVKAISSRGLAYLDLGKIPDARTDLEQIVKMSPHSSAAMVNLAKVCLAERNTQGALDLYNSALAADAKNFDAVSGIVNTSIRLGQTDKAHAKMDELIASNAGNGYVVAALHYLKSTIFISEKNAAAAEQELQTSIAQDGNYLPSYSTYANLLVSQNRTDEAIAQYQKVVDKQPAAQIYTMLGILEDARGKPEEAERNYRTALQVAPESAIAANNLAWLIAEHQGNLDEALQLATVAVNKNQSVAGYYDTLGWIYMKKGLYSMAIEQLKKAVALDESNAQKTGAAATPAYRERLGIALSKVGDKTSASLSNGNGINGGGA